MPISFGEYKSRFERAQADNLELMKALHETTINLKAALAGYKCLLAEVRKSKSDDEIDKMLSGYTKIILPPSVKELG